ncbi:hypothetical protein T484DRAFT_1860437 [Baffinella frigidus]|nr:hypothetical protein T484DRAFT_1860437 [Cryptophyta sp. CCMP2293]
MSNRVAKRAKLWVSVMDSDVDAPSHGSLLGGEECPIWVDCAIASGAVPVEYSPNVCHVKKDTNGNTLAKARFKATAFINGNGKPSVGHAPLPGLGPVSYDEQGVWHEVDLYTVDHVQFRLLRRDGSDGVVKFSLQRLGTRKELMDEFNLQVIAQRPRFRSVAQESRMLDKGAASLIAGSAGLVPDGNVWVNCNMETMWFDKIDERELMKVAWNDVIGKGNEFLQSNVPHFASGDWGVKTAGDPRLVHITNVLKCFRQAQLTMQLYSLSPAVEAVLTGIVLEMMDEFQEFSVFMDTSELTYANRSSVYEHDDTTRRLARVLRRLPVCRNEFCRVAGMTMRYNMALQEGAAQTTRRLNQIQADMRSATGRWLQFVGTNMNKILGEVHHCWATPVNFYVFDWTTHRMKLLDSEQYLVEKPPYHSSIEEEVMYQEVYGPRVCRWPEDVDVDTMGSVVLPEMSAAQSAPSRTVHERDAHVRAIHDPQESGQNDAYTYANRGWFGSKSG